MSPTPKKNGSNGKGSVAKGTATLPKRKAHSNNSRGRNVPTLTALSFCELFKFEAYIYEAKEGADGYLHGLTEILLGKKNCDFLTDTDSITLVTRRVSRSPSNDILKFSDPDKCKIWRKVIVRYVPDGTSPHSRQEGLQLLKQVFMHPDHTQYPPEDISTADITDTNHPLSLDQFFLDSDIKKFLKEEVDETALDSTFYSKYKDFALLCWSQPTYYPFATSLGFPHP